MAKGKSYDESLKKTIVELYEQGKSATELAREYDLSVKNIYNWTKLYGTIKAEDGTLTNNKEIIELKKGKFKTNLNNSSLKNMKHEDSII